MKIIALEKEMQNAKPFDFRKNAKAKLKLYGGFT